MRGLRRFVVVPVVLALVALLPACGQGRDPDAVRIGVNDLALPHREVYREKAADRGITVEFVNFSHDNQPNPALSRAGSTSTNSSTCATSRTTTTI